MISPQNLTIAYAAVGLAGREGDLLRKVLPWSLGLLLLICLIVVGQSTAVLSWMLPREDSGHRARRAGTVLDAVPGRAGFPRMTETVPHVTDALHSGSAPPAVSPDG
ncbi:L-lactate permease [Streptomyces sp. NPDC091209]|uniref:L-lactate permease n=1 Tax=Streptomyces sp. NPDC091209 TaxID=3365974 RepID=UPI00380B7C46